MGLAITRPSIIRAAVFLGAAAAIAAMLWATVANFGNDNVPGGSMRRDDRMFSLGLLAFGFAGLLAVPGAVLTCAFLRWPRAWLRRSYYTVLFLIVIANLLIFTTEGWRWATLFAWDGNFEMWWMQTIVPASLFVALAPPVKSMLAPHIGSQREGHVRYEVPIRSRVAESGRREPLPRVTVPRFTLWLAVAPWLFWIGYAQISAAPGLIFHTAVEVAYSAASYIALIATPVLGYCVLRDVRRMTRLQKVWSLASLAAGLAYYAFVGPIWLQRF